MNGMNVFLKFALTKKKMFLRRTILVCATASYAVRLPSARQPQGCQTSTSRSTWPQRGPPHLNASAQRISAAPSVTLHLIPSPISQAAPSSCKVLHFMAGYGSILLDDIAGISAFSYCRPDLVASSTAVTASCGGSFWAFPFSSS